MKRETGNEKETRDDRWGLELADLLLSPVWKNRRQSNRKQTESHFSDLAGLFFLVQVDGESKDNHYLKKNKKQETYTGLDQAKM